MDHGARYRGGVLQPAELCTKTGKRVIEVLLTKHPGACPPTAAILDTYPGRPPELIPMDITNTMVTEVAGRLSREAGTEGTDSLILHNWLLRFGAASGELRLIVADFIEWLGNERLPWSAYRALISVHLIAMDKQRGVRPVGVGKTWRQLMAKYVLWVTGQDYKTSCGTEQLAIGVEDGIEVVICDMHLL